MKQKVRTLRLYSHDGEEEDVQEPRFFIDESAMEELFEVINEMMTAYVY